MVGDVFRGKVSVDGIEESMRSCAVGLVLRIAEVRAAVLVPIATLLIEDEIHFVYATTRRMELLLKRKLSPHSPTGRQRTRLRWFTKALAANMPSLLSDLQFAPRYPSFDFVLTVQYVRLQWIVRSLMLLLLLRLKQASLQRLDVLAFFLPIFLPFYILAFAALRRLPQL